MRTVTVEVPEGHMVKIVKEESMQPTQKVMGGGKFEFEGETFIPGDVIINPNRGGGSMMILSEIREERPLPFLPAIKVPFGDRKSTRLNSSHIEESRMPSSA